MGCGLHAFHEGSFLRKECSSRAQVQNKATGKTETSGKNEALGRAPDEWERPAFAETKKGKRAKRAK